MISNTDFRIWIKLFAPKDWLFEIWTQYQDLLTQQCCDSINEELYQELLNIAEPSIIAKKFYYLDENNNQCPSELNNFSNEELKEAESKTLTFLLENGTGALSDFVPLLERKLTDHANSFISAISKLLGLIAVNRDAISARFFNGSSIGPLTGFKRFGKVYPGGKAVTELSFDDKKMIFKPRDCRIDAWFEDISQKYFSDCLYVPKTLALGEEAGFFEYIENKPAQGYEDAIAAIHSIGAFFAISDVFELFDLHLENYIVNEKLVVPIDLEGLLNVKFVHSDITDVLSFKFSPVQSYLLRFQLRTKEDIVNPFTDKTLPCSILPRIDEEPVSVTDYPAEFVKGFEEMYLRLIELKEEISSELEKTRGFFLRVFLPYGNNYMKAIEMLNRPVALASEKYQDFYLNWLRKKRGAEGKFYGDACFYENDWVVKGYAPRFDCRTDEKHLYYGSQLIARNVLRETAIETVQSNLRELDEELIPFFVRLIFWAFNKKIVHLPENSKLLQTSELKQLFTEIIESALICPDGHPIWLPEPVSDYSISSSDIIINRQKTVLDFCKKYIGDCKDEEVISRLKQQLS